MALLIFLDYRTLLFPASFLMSSISFLIRPGFCSPTLLFFYYDDNPTCILLLIEVNIVLKQTSFYCYCLMKFKAQNCSVHEVRPIIWDSIEDATILHGSFASGVGRLKTLPPQFNLSSSCRFL